MIPNLTFSIFQLAMRNAIESAFNETTLDDAVGGDNDAKKKVLLMSNSITNSMDQIRREPNYISIGIRVLQVMP